MSAARHNLTRRALLDAALAMPVVEGVACSVPLSENISVSDADWQRALASYRGAAAELLSFEHETAGAPWEEQEQIENRHGALSEASYRALRLLLQIPAPNVNAVSLKLDLTLEHEVVTLSRGEACLTALQCDARRLAAREKYASTSFFFPV